MSGDGWQRPGGQDDARRPPDGDPYGQQDGAQQSGAQPDGRQQGGWQQGGWQQPQATRPGPARPGGPGAGPGQLPPQPVRGAQRPVIPLRPLGLGDVLGGAFTVFRRNPRVLILWGLLLSGVLGAAAQVAQSLFQSQFQSRALQAAESGSGSDPDAVFAGSFTAMFVVLAAILLVTTLGKVFLQAPVAVDTGQRVLGRRGTFGGLWALLAGRRLAVVRWVLLELAAGVVLLAVIGAVVVSIAASGAVGAAVGVAVPLVLGFYVVVVWLGVKFSMTVPTIALEGLGTLAAAAQSWRLTRHAFWRTFGILLLVGVMFGFATGVAATPLSIATVFASGVFDPLAGSSGAPSTGGPSAGALVAIVIGGVLIAAVTTITDVLTAAVLTFLTIDRRIRTEGLDQRIASHLDTGSPADPFAPAPAGAGPTHQGPPPGWGAPTGWGAPGAAPWQQHPGAAQQPGPGAQQWPGQQAPGQQQWPGQQAPGQQQWPGQQAPGQQPWPGQQAPGQQPWPGQQAPGQQQWPGQQAPGQQPPADGRP